MEVNEILKDWNKSLKAKSCSQEWENGKERDRREKTRESLREGETIENTVWDKERQRKSEWNK